MARQVPQSIARALPEADCSLGRLWRNVTDGGTSVEASFRMSSRNVANGNEPGTSISNTPNEVSATRCPRERILSRNLSTPLVSQDETVPCGLLSDLATSLNVR